MCATRGFQDVAPDALRWLICFRVCMPATYALTLVGLTFVAAGWIAAVAAALMGKPMVLADAARAGVSSQRRAQRASWQEALGS